MNNFEKIKSLTLDEMAKLIICAVTSKCLVDDCANCMLKYLCDEITEDNEQEIVTQWLQAESEEE